jgi:hypothetical protein
MRSLVVQASNIRRVSRMAPGHRDTSTQRSSRGRIPDATVSELDE